MDEIINIISQVFIRRLTLSWSGVRSMEDVVMMCGQGVVCRVVGLRKGEDKGGYIGRTRGGGE